MKHSLPRIRYVSCIDSSAHHSVVTKPFAEYGWAEVALAHWFFHVVCFTQVPVSIPGFAAVSWRGRRLA